MTQDQNHADRLIDFFQRYQRFKEQTSMQLWVEKEQAYSGLIKRFAEERSKAIEAERLVASDYNVFSILKLRFSEVRLHTPILANLLDPVGSHSQGLLFYNLFIRRCIEKDRQDRFLNVAPHELEVSPEGRNPYGQIDIFLCSSNPQNRFAIIIENKIWAKDQFRQLYRYFQYAKQGLGLNLDKICVLYLTPYCKDPSFDGLKAAEQQMLEKVLVKVGYHSHVIPFLSEALEKIGSDKVKQTIYQYIQTLEDL